MRKKILALLEYPAELEKLYRDNKASFKSEFNALYPELNDQKIAEYWYERLNYERPDISWGNKFDLFFVILASLIGAFLIRIPDVFSISGNFFYPRNLGFVFLPLLSAYFIWKNQLKTSHILGIAIFTLISLLFINIVPFSKNSHTFKLSCIHLPILLWGVLGYAYTGKKVNSHEQRLSFLRFNGDLAIITGLILIAGMLLSGLTIGLFDLIHINIEIFYFENVVLSGLAAAPIVGTYIIQQNPYLVNKVSPIIAKIFSPLVLITLVIYLVAVINSGSDPYNNREFLLIFNILLLGVMAIILFSIVESSRSNNSRIGTLILFLLALASILVNLVALSAIVYRIYEWGFTPNRLAVFGSNILILIHLIMVGGSLFQTLRSKASLENVAKAITIYLPIYLAWAGIVIFIFPFLFGLN